jgi:hypothetical protein
MFFCDFSSVLGFRGDALILGSYLPPSHIWLYIKELVQSDTPRLARSCLKHEPTKLGVEYWKN